MKTLLTIYVALIISSPAMGAWNSVHVSDEHTRGLWHFDGTTGDTNIVDASVNSNTAALYNPNSSSDQLDSNLTWGASMPGFGNAALTWWNSSSDLNRGCLYVDQTTPNDSLRISTDTDLTIEFWLKPQFATYTRTIMAKYTGGNYKVDLITGSIGLIWYAPGIGWISVADTTVLEPNVWKHVAITMDRTSDPSSSVVSFWIDGQLSSSTDSGWAPNGGTPNKELSILANRAGAYPYYGAFDELRISDIIRYTKPPSGTLICIR